MPLEETLSSIPFEAIHNAIVNRMPEIMSTMVGTAYDLMLDFLHENRRTFSLKEGHENIEILEEEMDLLFRTEIENALRRNGIKVNISWKSDSPEIKEGGSLNPADPKIMALYDWCDGGTNFARRLLTLVQRKNDQKLTEAEKSSFSSNSAALLTFAEKKPDGRLSRPMVSITHSLLYGRTYSHFRESEQNIGSAFDDGRIVSEQGRGQPRVGLIRIVLPGYVNYMSEYLGIFNSRLSQFLREHKIGANCSIATGSSANDLVMLAEGEFEGYIDIREKLTSLNPTEDATLQEEDIISIKEYLIKRGIHISKPNGLQPDLITDPEQYAKKQPVSLVALNFSRLKDKEIESLLPAIDFGLYHAMKSYYLDKAADTDAASLDTPVNDFKMFSHAGIVRKETQKNLEDKVNEVIDLLDNSHSLSSEQLERRYVEIIDWFVRKTSYHAIADAAIVHALFSDDASLAESQFEKAAGEAKRMMQNLISRRSVTSNGGYRTDYNELSILRRDLAGIAYNHAMHLKHTLNKANDIQERQRLTARIIDLLSSSIENYPLFVDSIVEYAAILHKDKQDTRSLVYLNLADDLIGELKNGSSPSMFAKAKLYQLGKDVSYDLSDDASKQKFALRHRNLYLPEIRDVVETIDKLKLPALAAYVGTYLEENVVALNEGVLSRLKKFAHNLDSIASKKESHELLSNIEKNIEIILDVTFGIPNWNVVRYIGNGKDKHTLEVVDGLLGNQGTALKVLIPKGDSGPEKYLRLLESEQISELSRANEHLVFTHSPGTFVAPNGTTYFYYLEELFDDSLDSELCKPRFGMDQPSALTSRLDLFFDIFGQVLQGAKGCHEAGYIHDGIKAENILLRKRNDKMRAALCDFSTMVSERNSEKSSGSKLTMPVELMDGSSPSFATDTFRALAEGYNLLFGAYPFAEQKKKPKDKIERERFDNIIQKRAHMDNYSYLFEPDYNPYFGLLPDPIKEDIKTFFMSGLRRNPAERAYCSISDLETGFSKLKLAYHALNA